MLTVVCGAHRKIETLLCFIQLYNYNDNAEEQLQNEWMNDDVVG